MLTQCPNCDTTFRVTSEILRVAQGQVRCGRCDTQFDALERLIEEEDAVEDGTDDSDGDMQLSEPDLEEEAEIDPEAEPAEEWVEFDDVSAADDADSAAETIAEEEIADVEVVEEEPEEYVEDEEEELEEAREEVAVAPSRIRSNYAQERRERPAISPVQQQAVARPAPTFEDTDQFELGRSPLRVPSAAAWKYLAIPLMLLFAFQVFNHYRAPMARNPRIGGFVSGLYRMLGIDVIPDWDLRAYKIKRTFVGIDPTIAGALRVQARVRNSAAFPQPYPLLKVVLEDRYGDAVRAREFEPTEYLDKAPAANARMAPQQEIIINISVVDPGNDAAGSRFDVCLRGNNGSVCAEDLPAAR